jgi:hypothetical protein
MPKSVVYLLGSGATHAVVNYLDPSKGLLTSHVRDVISKKEAELKDAVFPTNIWNELIDDRVDIEHLISIMEANYNYKVTNDLRKYYSQAISELSNNIVTAEDSSINLYSILFDMYSIKGFSEDIDCVLTLNYEDIFEESIKQHLGKNFDYIIENSKQGNTKKSIPVLKLHGSFNWKNVRPVEIDKSGTVISNGDALWIPPGVEKKKEKYPFNLLWGKAFEYLLECDVLRIIGCSLSRNDWDLIPLIYSTNKFNSRSRPFEIEIIDYPSQCDKIISQYQYLKIKHIFDIKEVSLFLLRQHFPHLANVNEISDEVREELTNNIVPPNYNIFSMWLQAIGEGLLEKGVDLNTPNNIFDSFIRNGLRA